MLIYIHAKVFIINCSTPTDTGGPRKWCPCRSRWMYVFYSLNSTSHFKDVCDLCVDMCLCVPPGSVGLQDSPTVAKEEPVPAVQESSVKRLVVGPLEVRLHSSAVHRILKMVACAMDHEYEPYCKPEPGQRSRSCTHTHTHTHTHVRCVCGSAWSAVCLVRPHGPSEDIGYF